MSAAPKKIPVEDTAIYEVLLECAANDSICPSNAELMALTGLTNDSAINRRLRRLKEMSLIKVASKGGFRQIYVSEIDKWTSARPTAGANMAEFIDTSECLTSLQEQCAHHTAQLRAANVWFESYKLKPMQTLDWTKPVRELTYGVVNYSSIGWR